MKMEIAIAAPVTGRLRAIHPGPGDLVRPGDAIGLIEIDAGPG
jgi:biotin carboxyl carrier protein